MLRYLRLALFAIYTTLISIWGIIYSLFRPRHPNNVHHVAHLFGWGFKHILGVKVEVENPENLETGKPTVYICNHQSNWDLFVWGTFVPKRTVSVGKKEILYIPIFGWMYWLTGNVILDRQNRNRSALTINNTVRDIRDRKISISIFPEGTRSHGKEMGRFKKGAFYTAIETQVPIVPVCVRPYYEDMQRLKNVCIKVSVLPEIPTTGLTEKNVTELMENAKLLMITELKRL